MRRYTGSPRDGIAFALACRALAAEALRARVPGRLLSAPVDAVDQAGADLIEAFCATGGE